MLICDLMVPAGKWSWGGDCLCMGWSDIHHWPQSDRCQISSRWKCQCILCRWGAWLQRQPSQHLTQNCYCPWEDLESFCLSAVGNNFPVWIMQKAQLIFHLVASGKSRGGRRWCWGLSVMVLLPFFFFVSFLFFWGAGGGGEGSRIWWLVVCFCGFFFPCPFWECCSGLLSSPLLL